MESEMIIRAVAFVSVFAMLAATEIFIPRRKLKTSKFSRWFANLAIVAMNPLSLAIVFPILPVGLAMIASEQNWGLFNNLDIPYWVKIVAGVVLLDLAVYMQHVMHHAIPVFWRLHMMHHADMDIDMTTGLRFHPIEILVSMTIKLATVAAFGIPVVGVLIFEVALNATSMFNHSNIHIPGQIDRVLRLIVVTPDMHRVHHSVIIRETNSNYGFNLPWWDRLFGTYKAQPEKGHKDMNIGLSQFRDPKRLTLPHLLILPFTGDPGRVPINRH